ncbi:MAG: hypothetical protein AB7F59_00295 [Bdellovibrionales bacterium]
MLIKFCYSMKNLAKRSKAFPALFIIFICTTIHADPPIEDLSRTFLQLKNRTWLHLKKGDWEKNYDRVNFIYGRGRGTEKKKDIIWSKVYQTNDDRAWNYAYFLRLKPGRFAYDLDGDGNKEIGVATYDMGNNMIRNILIFSIHKDQIVFVREHGPYNVAADEPVF